MASIEQHISELLFDHDCVIGPSLGGFLASNQNSVITANLVLFPPFRKIAFNVYLKNNDGLLANHLVEYEHISYQQALIQIEKFVATCMSEMNDGKKVYFNTIGTLFFDKEHNIQFEAARNSNHLKDSFGMDALQLTPISRENEPTLKPKPVLAEIRPSKPQPRTISPRLKKSGRLVGIVAVAATALWFSFNLYLVNPKTYDAASLSPFDSQAISLKLKDTSTLPTTIKQEQPAKVETVYVSNTTPEVKPAPETIVPETVVPEKQPEVLPSTVSTGDNHHFVVAGVFKIHENALSQLDQLQKLGFKNASMTEANNRWYVYYQGFENRSEAIALTDSLKNSNLQGWIWNY